MASILCVTKKPPKIFIAASAIAKNPKILEVLKIFSELYGLSSVTIIKTFNKLKTYDNQIKQLLEM